MTLSIVGCSIIWAHWQWGNLRLFSLVFPSVRWDPPLLYLCQLFILWFSPLSGDIPLYCIYVNFSYSGFPLCQCQGTTCFPLQSCLRVLPTPTLDTFGILQTPTTSQFQRCFEVLPILSPFQQSSTLPHAPSILTPHLTLPLKAAPRAPPPPKVTQRPLQIPHPPIWNPVQHSSETLWAIVEIGRLLWHLISRVKSLKQYTMSRVDGGQDRWGMPGNGPNHRLV